MNDDLTYEAAEHQDGWIGVAEAAPNPIREKSFDFALATIDLYKRLQADREFVVPKQLLRSGTSIGANVEEAAAAESKRDFIH